ncbi:MAG: sodium/proline symporter, partial [Planctomycetota bacterium]|nr:sodium/proline symporter [Planctomycetota bacterium]
MTTLISTLVVYKLLLLGIGAWASRRSSGDADFYLGGRGLGPWIASLSSAASSSSAWTLLGVSGAAFTWGWSAVWLLPACLLGFAFNWFVVAERLRTLSAESGAITFTGFLCGESRPLRWLASFIILLSLGVYVASQFKAAGVTFSETLGMGETAAICIGGGIVLIYTMTGGFWAVSVTDFVQGLVMVFAAVLVPAMALIDAGGWSGMMAGLENANDPVLLDPFRGKIGASAFGFILGTLGIGLGYPGQPHVSNRFMAMRRRADVRAGTWISLTWALLIYSGMLVAGWCGHALLQDLGN